MNILLSLRTSAVRLTARRSPPTLIRTRTGKASRTPSAGNRPPPPRHSRPAGQHVGNQAHPVQVDDIGAAFARGAQPWSASPSVRKRLSQFGLPPQDIPKLLQTYVDRVKEGEMLGDLKPSEEELDRIRYDFAHPGTSDPFDVHMSKTMFEWAASPAGHTALQGVISPAALSLIRELFTAADLSRPSSWHSRARRSGARKVIMHVGPTNSGKTHNALRALAAARTGAYAGPLRLLAHEIWERLNKGQIVPLGAEATAEADDRTNIEVGDAPKTPVVQKAGNAEFARVCNLMTGEEQRILDTAAPLVSCTVEMMSNTRFYDVAVVDEIQMIADSERGFAWTNAVLGVNATELHLCGEETAVPLVEAMLRDTGDELSVNRYERLSPLRVADESLDGKLDDVQKGDCVVSFSRKNIFKIKREIETTKKIRCAVAYGRLPPELRSEQAALFNDPDSGYDVLVASDAVGMGLNLKIKRVILETTTKFDGSRMRPLEDSSIKQIGGRAGRFGLHGDDPNAGVVTTIHAPDLPVVRSAFQRSVKPLRFARINAMTTTDSQNGILQVLPEGTSANVVALVYQYISKMHPLYESVDFVRAQERLDVVDKLGGAATIEDRILFQTMPVPTKDEIALVACTRMLNAYRTDMRVYIRRTLEESSLWAMFQKTLERLRSSEKLDPIVFNDALSLLESLHKFLVTYLWLTYRQPIAFPDQQPAWQIKEECEAAMNTCLERLSIGSNFTEESLKRAEKRVQIREWANKSHNRKESAPSKRAERKSNKTKGAPSKPTHELPLLADKPRRSSTREVSA